MAKKIVRGITDVKTINNQDYDTNNVNDLLSDGQYNYIHRKKGESEEYHNLTDNIKTLSSDNTELLSVTNNNKTTNTATLHPKHDAQKEQVLESTRNTVTINHGTNGTAEKTTVDTNPEKVLEHENLQTYHGISKTTSGSTIRLGIEYKQINEPLDLNTVTDRLVRSNKFINAPKENTWFFVSSFTEHDYTVQEAVTIDDAKNTTYRRLKRSGDWGEWREQVGDKSVIDGLLAQKQNTIISNASIGVINNSLQQLYCWYETYTHENALLKTYVKSISSNTNVATQEEEFNFILKINQGFQSASFTLREHEKMKFSSIITAYATGNAVVINGCLFTLSDHTLTVTIDGDTARDHVITFSDII